MSLLCDHESDYIYDAKRNVITRLRVGGRIYMFWLSGEDVITCIGGDGKPFVVDPDHKDFQDDGTSIFTWDAL